MIHLMEARTRASQRQKLPERLPPGPWPLINLNAVKRRSDRMRGVSALGFHPFYLRARTAHWEVKKLGSINKSRRIGKASRI
jgi:hypothetical protein